MKRARIILGTHGPWWWRKTVALKPADIQSHMHISGITGSGKSRFLAHLFLAMHAAGYPATLIDPHGDLVRLIMAHLVQRRFYRDPRAAEQVIYLDLPGAARRGLYVPFNVLKHPALPGPAIEGNVLDAMHRAWPSLGEGAAPRFDKLVQRGVRVLLSNGLPLPALETLLTNPVARTAWLKNELDRGTVAMFRNQFERLSVRDQLDYADSTLSRITLLTQDPVLRYSLLQEENLFDFRALMDAGRSVLIDLSLPNPGAKRLFGSFLTVAAEQGAKSRAEIRSGHRGKTHHLFIDEFQLFTAQSAEALTAMLSETRKYGMFAVLSHQNWSQIPPRLRGGLENCRVEVVFAQGALDAEYSARLLLPVEARTVRRRSAEDGQDESIGLREQLEGGRQSLADQWQGEAFISVHTMTKSHGLRQVFTRDAPRSLTQVRIPQIPDPQVDGGELAEVEERYFANPAYFTPQERIAETVDTWQGPPTLQMHRHGSLPDDA